jgi:hypothetical protein
MKPAFRLARHLSFALLAASSGPLLAQPNVQPGLDLALEDTWNLNDYDHAGTFPTGASGFGAWTTCCNPGTVPVLFQAAMDPDHGFIHFIVARESNGRLEQISDWSYVKHTFGSSNDPSSCGTCAGPGVFSQVEVGCSDTYANFQAVDHYWLGPPGEINAWTGVWDPICSHFDRGEPPVAPAQQCDGVRSLSQTQAGVLNAGLNHQMRVYDADLIVPGATYWYQAGYLVPGEAEALRGNNIGSRLFTATWTGSSYAITTSGTLLPGSILQRWTGATISSATNGIDDGRFYVAVKVTGPVAGLYHYSYAVHNRDNDRGLGALRIPVCPGATVANFGFHDVDQLAGNAWTASVAGGEIQFTTANNPLYWNSFFNFWFDSDAAPVTGASISLDQFEMGPGAPTVVVTSTAPLGLYNQNLGAGCGNPSAPSLYATGSPPRATLGNASFGLQSAGNAPSTPSPLLMSLADGTFPLAPGCTLYSASVATIFPPFNATSNGAGLASYSLPVPATPALEGQHVDFQSANLVAGGAYLGAINLSNGLRVRLGNTIPTCP